MKSIIQIVCIVFTLLVASTAFADSAIAEFAWGASSSPVDGYRIFLKENGQEYDYQNPTVEVAGITLTAQVKNLDIGKQYFAVCRAFKGSAESVDSDEVIFTVPPVPVKVEIPDRVTGISIKFIYE